MHLTSDEKLVASAMAGLKRPHQSLELNSASSEDNTMASSSPTMGASTSPFSKRMKDSTREPQFNNSDVTSAATNMATLPLKIVTTTNSTPISTVKTATIGGFNASDDGIIPISQEHHFVPRHYNDQMPSVVACGQLEAMSITTDSNSGNTSDENENSNGSAASGHRELLPAPYFYYRDFSQTPDDDPLTPLTPLARVPNFPAKMHAILSREDLADVVTWMPHGRSWKVLKPREFEIRVIPAYFEHSKFSSFIRQANGWGFRRITRGKDRNSYYHELFLRGLPHLCKQMRRPGVSKKLTVDVGHEPDLYQISQEFPVPEKMENSDSIMLPNTLLGGPKARMPVGLGTAYVTSSSGDGKMPSNSMNLNPYSSSSWHSGNSILNASAATGQQYASGTATSSVANSAGAWLAAQKMPHRQPTSLEASDSKLSAGKPDVPQPAQAMQSLKDAVVTNLSTTIPILPRPFGLAPYQTAGTTSYSAAAHQQNLAQSLQRQQQLQQQLNPCNSVQLPSVSQLQQQAFGNNQQQTPTFHQALSAAAAAIGSEPTSQFAAGFAAAAALSNPHFQRAFHQALAKAATIPSSNVTLTHGGFDGPVGNEDRLKDHHGV